MLLFSLLFYALAAIAGALHYAGVPLGVIGIAAFFAGGAMLGFFIERSATVANVGGLFVVAGPILTLSNGSIVSDETALPAIVIIGTVGSVAAGFVMSQTLIAWSIRNWILTSLGNVFRLASVWIGVAAVPAFALLPDSSTPLSVTIALAAGMSGLSFMPGWFLWREKPATANTKPKKSGTLERSDGRHRITGRRG